MTSLVCNDLSVASWRDTASREAQEDLDGLLNATLPFAEGMLKDHGEFYPFAARVTAEGTVTMVAGFSDGADRPLSTDVIELLYEGLAGLASQSRAVAVALDVRMPSTGDAIRVEMEHRDGIAIALLLPHRTKRFGRAPEFGDLEAAVAAPRVWS